MPDTMDDPLYTVAEVALRMRYTAATVRTWIARGELPALRIGRTIRIRHADLATFIRNHDSA